MWKGGGIHSLTRCLLQVRHALNAVLGKQRMPMPISRREWCMIQEYCDSLKMFKEATQVIIIEDKPTLCRYIPTVYGLKQIFATSIEKKRAIPDTIRLRNNLLLILNTRFQFIDDDEPLMIAMILDPRIKDGAKKGIGAQVAALCAYAIRRCK